MSIFRKNNEYKKAKLNDEHLGARISIPSSVIVHFANGDGIRAGPPVLTIKTGGKNPTIKLFIDRHSSVHEH